MNGTVVVDASLAVKWLVNEEGSEMAVALAETWVDAGVSPVAPYLLPVEVANALYRRVVRKELTAATAVELQRALDTSGIALHEPAGAHTRAIEIAAQLGQSAAYDAHYLAVAELLDCELWTADRRFHAAATAHYPTAHWLGEANS